MPPPPSCERHGPVIRTVCRSSPEGSFWPYSSGRFLRSRSYVAAIGKRLTQEGPNPACYLRRSWVVDSFPQGTHLMREWLALVVFHTCVSRIDIRVCRLLHTARPREPPRLRKRSLPTTNGLRGCSPRPRQPVLRRWRGCPLRHCGCAVGRRGR
jgi:hypothetical protein